MGDERGKALRVEVVRCNHLPKVDWGTGKVDAFVEVEFEDRKEKTQIIMKNYDPIFNDSFVYDVPVPNEVGDLEITVQDWDKNTKNDLVGTCRVPQGDMARLMAFGIGADLPPDFAEMTLELTMKGKKVVGNDKKNATVTLKFAILESLRKGLIRPGFGGSSKSLGSDGETPKMLEIVVHSVQHLPKMDTFGKCDPFVKIAYGSEPTVQTQVIKNVWEGFFEEKFGWDLTDSEGKINKFEDLKLQLFDWNQVGSSDLIGEVSIPKSKIEEIMSRSVGHEDRSEFAVKKDGSIDVRGKDGQNCVLSLTLRVSAMTAKRLERTTTKSGLLQKAGASVKDIKAAISGTPPKPKKDAKKAIKVTLISGDHMPNKDGMFGKCDPMVELRYGTQKFESKVAKNTYSPVWKQDFIFDIKDSKVSGDIVLTVSDWDMASANDFIGTARINISQIDAELGNPIGHVGEKMVVEIVDGNGKQVKGKDKSVATLTVQLGVAEEIPKPEGHDQAAAISAELELVKSNPQKAAMELARLRQELENKERARKETMTALGEKIKKAEEGKKAVQSVLDTKGPIADGIFKLVPQKDMPSQYSDLTIEAEAALAAEGEKAEVKEFQAHCCIVWAMCEGLHEHLELAKGKDKAKGEKHVVYLKWHEDKLVIEGEVAGEAEADKEKENIKDGDKNKHAEHDWDPKTCVSVPGSVYGVPMRCSCAHGAFSIGSKGIGKLCPRCMGRMDGNSGSSTMSDGPLLFRINGVLPSVIGKVLCYIYSARCEPPFTLEEVPDAILVAKYFGLKFLLTYLYLQGWFPKYGMAMWEAAQYIAVRFPHTEAGAKGTPLHDEWFNLVLTNKHNHFEEGTFKDDGAKYLSKEGFTRLLAEDFLFAEEIQLYKAVMMWGKERLRKHRAAEKAWEEKTYLKDPNSKQKVKKWAFKDASEEVMRAVRFPFISIDNLNTTVSMDEDFMKGNFCDSSNVPLVLRAVFQQNGQNFPTSDPDISWKKPRIGSIHYNGEWEWKYCRAAFKDMRKNWPVKDKYYDGEDLMNMSWMTDEEIRANGLSKVEIYNLILDEYQDVTLQEIVDSFLYVASKSQLVVDDEGLQERAAVDQALHGVREKTGLDKIKEGLKVLSGDSKARIERAKEKLRAEVKRIAKEARFLRAVGGSSTTRGLVAAGRVRKSIHANKNTDPRLHGHCFLVFDNLSDARDVILKYHNKPFYKVVMKQDKQGHNVPDKWEKMGTELLNIRLVGANDEFVENKASGFARTASGSTPKRSMSRSISSFSGFSR